MEFLQKLAGQKPQRKVVDVAIATILLVVGEKGAGLFQLFSRLPLLPILLTFSLIKLIDGRVADAVHTHAKADVL